MKTLVFCTSYAGSPTDWESRYALWVRSVRYSGLAFDQLLIVDDASPSLPDWVGTQIVHQRDVPEIEDIRPHEEIIVYRHHERLGRNGVFDCPGWHRSFAFGIMFAEALGFEKVVHLESDAHLISGRIARHLNDVLAGWFAPHSRRYSFPEMAIQVAAGGQIAEMAHFARKPYAEICGRVHELQVPYTHVEHLYRGDRYGELLDYIPHEIDFATQVLSDQGPAYHWWLDGENRAPRSHADGKTANCFEIGPEELQNPYLFEGDWSAPEPPHRWMTAFDSQVRIPQLPAVRHILELRVQPLIAASKKNLQRLLVLMNEQMIGEFDVFRDADVFCDVPANALNPLGPNLLRLLHPDTVSIMEVHLDSADTRHVSLALKRLKLTEA